MILPTILHGFDQQELDVLLPALKDVSLKAQTPFRVQMITGDVSETVAALQQERDITLLILGVEPLFRDRQRLALRLGKLAIQQNRDHYVVYVVKEPGELPQVVPLCTRAAGILPCPLTPETIEQAFLPVLEDYRKLYESEPQKEGHWINLKSAGKIQRILLDDVCMVQAVNKTVEFRTFGQVITVYTTMDAVEKMLGDSFLRCHRSYFINRYKIQYVDFREMVIHMIDGSQAMLSRSFKESIHRSFEEAT